MNSVRKRKASIATPAAPSDGSATKRLKLLNSNSATPTTTTTLSKAKVQEIGKQIVEQLQTATDKTGRLIADEFLELPDRDDLPDYYEFTKLPIAIETIQTKLKRREYSNVTSIESDFKRLVQNAKDYNDPNSQIYEDAEKIRKIVLSFMKQHNPAYTDQPGYTAFPTPIPDAPPAASRGTPRGAERPARRASAPSASNEEPEVEAEEDGDEDGDEKAEEGEEAAEEGDDEEDAGRIDVDFTGQSFQEAQQTILTTLLEYTDEEGLEIYSPFGYLPSRKLEDYYKVIRHPVCLRSVAKRARGQHGRADPTGISDFKTWDAFEDEVSFIWRNAKTYNEDGSDMFILATDFEKHFRSLLDEAKVKVEEPSAPRIKLGGPKPKVTLNLAQHRASPTPPASNITVDNDAQRQRQSIQVANGQQPTPAAAVTATATGPQISAVNGARPSSSAHSDTPSTGGIKLEKAATQSPGPNGIQQSVANGIMPPPLGRPPSGSPYPPAQPSSFSYPAPALLPPTPLRNYPIEAALLPTVAISTHPHLKLPHPYALSIAPHATLSHQSSTITLPHTHYFLQIAPTIAKPLSMGRPYKMFVSLNGTRLNQRDTQFHADTGKRTHVYEGTLAPGVNRVEVEVAAAPTTAAGSKDEEGNSTTAAENVKGLDVEKVTLYANLLRAA